MLRESVADRVHRPGSERSGTATRLSGIYYAADGTPLALGGKTRTGDNRLENFGRGQYVIASEVGIGRQRSCYFLAIASSAPSPLS